MPDGTSPSPLLMILKVRPKNVFGRVVVENVPPEEF
ncbi:MAG: hypothetical protein CM15mV111_040 [uncultured marine virus]|nr:MAG: hypothetical protein CM15mV111_040 [uncultured marine virus]